MKYIIKNNMSTKRLKNFLGAVLVFLLVVSMSGINTRSAQAAALTALSDTMSSQKAATVSSHVIKFTTPTGAEESTDTIIITFPSTGTTPFNFSSKTIGTVTFTHGSSTGAETTETLAASPSATEWGAAFSGTQNRVLTLTAPTDGVGAGTFAATQKAIITYNSTNSTNPSANASPYAIAISGTFGDTGSITVPILSDDQVAVSSTVDQSLTFSLGSTTAALGTLSSSAVTSTSHTLTVSTNATSGMVVTVAGATLTSGANTITAMSSATTSSVGTEQFGINLKNNATPDVGAEVSGSAPLASAATGYATADNFKFVTGETIASSAGGINSSVFTVSYIANILGSTEAGSYTATLTYTATATF
mgnify:CR=1 FL=1